MVFSRSFAVVGVQRLSWIGTLGRSHTVADLTHTNIMVMVEKEHQTVKVPVKGSLHLKVPALLQQTKLHRKKLNQLLLNLRKMDRT